MTFLNLESGDLLDCHLHLDNIKHLTKKLKLRINHQQDYALIVGLMESSSMSLVGTMSPCVIIGAGHTGTCAFQMK